MFLYVDPSIFGSGINLIKQRLTGCFKSIFGSVSLVHLITLIIQPQLFWKAMMHDATLQM